MITIHIKIYCREIVKGLEDGDYELPDGATVNDALIEAQRKAGARLSDGAKNSIVFLLDGRPAELGTPLSDGGKLRILQKVLGG